jgi:hypothetical protein
MELIIGIAMFLLTVIVAAKLRPRQAFTGNAVLDLQANIFMDCFKAAEQLFTCELDRLTGLGKLAYTWEERKLPRVDGKGDEALEQAALQGLYALKGCRSVARNLQDGDADRFKEQLSLGMDSLGKLERSAAALKQK